MTEEYTELTELPGFPDPNGLFPLSNPVEQTQNPESNVPKSMELPEDLKQYAKIFEDLKFDPSIVPGLTLNEFIGELNPAFSDLTDKSWRRLMIEIIFWSIVARREAIFSAYPTCTFVNDPSDPHIAVTADGFNMTVSLYLNCTGIMVSIFQIFDGNVYGTTFIVDPMNEITVCNINGIPLHENIVVASVVDGEVIFSDIIHTAATAIYTANRDVLETLLLQQA